MESVVNPKPTFSMLLVEDEEDTLELLAMILPKKFPDALLHTADNGIKGLDLFTTHLPDIVITDFIMPEMSGSHMIDKIRAIKPDTKFIIITGDTGQLAMEESDNKGFEFEHVIEKPVVFQALFTAIEQCRGESMSCSPWATTAAASTRKRSVTS